MADLRTFGVVLFKGFELLDVFGPLEAWGMLANMGQCKVTTVAERAGAVTSAQGPKAIADYGFVVANGRIAHEGPSAALSRNPDVIEAFLGKKKSTSLTTKPKE